jgi:hypothetical protein
MRPRLAVRPVLGSLLAAVVALAIVRDLLKRETVGIDFHTYLAAAIVGMREGWGRIYDQGAVAAVQRALDSHVWAQPFLSTPPVALLAAPFSVLPYPAAYLAWATLTLVAFAGALAWSTSYVGAARWLAVAVAIVPWWVIHAAHVGQVAPLIGAAVLVAWRLLRERRDAAAGLVLTLLVLKPNTAFLVPVALLFIGRWRALSAWLAGSAVLVLGSLAFVGPGGAEAYANALLHVPAAALRGASELTLATAFKLSPTVALGTRLIVLGAALAAMYRYRRESGMAIAVASVASLLAVTYLHASDLCLFVAAGWIVWHERPEPAWRALLAGIWVLATPFLEGSALAPALNRWVACELLVMVAFALDAFVRPLVARRRASLTGWAAYRNRAPA